MTITAGLICAAWVAVAVWAEYREIQMTRFISAEDEFGKASPAAAEIFKYVEEHRRLGPFGFERGTIGPGLNTTSATLSCVNVSGWGRDELLVQARRSVDGGWALTHTLNRGVKS